MDVATLCSAVFSPDPYGIDPLRAARALAAEFESASAKKVLLLDRENRERLPRFTPDQLNRGQIALASPHGWAVLAALSSTANGYLREEVVCRLAHHRGGEEIPFLLLRLNDWVVPIRSRAKTAILERLNIRYGSELLTHLPLLDRLRKWGRSDHSELICRIDSFLTSPSMANARQRALKHPSPGVRRSAFQLALKADQNRLPEMLLMAARDKDAWMRRRTIDLIEKHDVTAHEQALRLLLLDTVLVTRQEAQRLIRQGAIRTSLRDFYTQQLSRPAPELRAALFGLGESGQAEDSVLVFPFLDHQKTAIRRAALYALGWLDLEGSLQRVVELVGDGSARISNDASRLLIRNAHLISACRPQLEDSGDFPRDGHVFRNTQAVLAAGVDYRNRWSESAPS
jgi:hypothetical protein